jgi:hypothetical protein
LVGIWTNRKGIPVLVKHIQIHAGRLQEGGQAGVLASLKKNKKIKKIYLLLLKEIF